MQIENDQLDIRSVSNLIEIGNKIFILSTEKELGSLLGAGLAERGNFCFILKDFIKALKDLKNDKEFFDYIKNKKLPKIHRLEHVFVDFLKLEQQILLEMGMSHEYVDFLSEKLRDLLQEIEDSGCDNWFWPAPWNAKARIKRASRMRFLLSEIIYLLEEAYDISRKHEISRRWTLVRGVLRRSVLLVGGIATIVGDASFLAPSLGLSAGASALSIFLGEEMAVRAFKSKDL